MGAILMSINTRIIKTAYSILFFAIPLILSPYTNELFEFPKMILVYSATLLILAASSVKMIILGKITIPKSPINKAILFYSILYFLSFILSHDKYTSLFGYYTRFNGGLLSLICYVILFFIFINEFRGIKDVIFPIYSLVITSTIVSVYAVLQHIGIDKHLWIQNSQARAFSTIGQPNWLASFLTMVFPITLGFMILKKKRGAKIVFLTSCFLLLISIWFTYSLSGLIGLLVSVLIFLTLMPKKLLSENRYFLLILTTSTIFIMILRPGIFAPKIYDAYQNLKEVFVSISYAKEDSAEEFQAEDNKPKISDTTRIRLNVWKGALHSVTSSPKNIIIGSGPETFAYIFPAFKPKELNYTSEWDFLFNKAHNLYLDLAVNLGVLGLLAYVIMVLQFVLWIRKIINNNRDDKETDVKLIILCGLLSGLAALLITDFFGWQTVTTGFLFWMYMAITASLNNKRGRDIIKKGYPLNLLKAILLITVVLLFSYALFGIFRIYKADVYYARGKSTGNLNLLKGAVILNPREPAYHRELARIYANRGEGGKFLKEAETAFRLNPKNMLTIKSLIGSYSQMAMYQPDSINEAIRLAEYGAEISPNDVKLKFILGNLYYVIGDEKKAEEFTNLAIKLKPDYQEPRELLKRLDNQH